DLLYLIRRNALEQRPHREPLKGFCTQAELTKDLGLHRSTVAVLVERLLELGWIWRRRDEHDRRTFDILLTKEGLRRIGSARKGVFRTRILRKRYERMFRTSPEMPVLDVVKLVHRAVVGARNIARDFGDRAWVWYDYGYPPENERRAVKM